MTDKPSSSEDKKKEKPQWDENANHGNTPGSAYTGCKPVDIDFEDALLKKGLCPDCDANNTVGSLQPLKKAPLVFLTGLPIIHGERCSLASARCRVCDKVFTASLPECYKHRSRYDEAARSSIAINHYFAGLPFKRLELLQANQGIPLADATAYDLMNGLYCNVVRPVFQALVTLGAQSQHIDYDDTPMRVLSQTIKKNRSISRIKGVHSSAFVCQYQQHRIALFFTDTQVAGHSASDLLKRRFVDEDFITMCDASGHNVAGDFSEAIMARWIISLCLVHGRRKFVELLKDKDPVAEHVVDTLAKVYHYESNCKRLGLDDEARLAYHQVHSAPIMDNLHIWLNNLVLHGKVEPNSPLGKAVAYLLKHWHGLTQFLRVLGAKLDNNMTEQLVKVMIRYRKNSLTFKTFYGAAIGDAMMSVLQTAHYAGVNLFDYLNTLQRHKVAVQANPFAWLPWCYKASLAKNEVPYDEESLTQYA